MSRACVCGRLHAGRCWYCQFPRTPAEREAFIQRGIPRKEEKPVWTRDQEFEAERKRLSTKKRRRK